MKQTNVVIIGTGPYGISVANALHARNIDFQIIGIPFSLWFKHTQDTMAIRSDWHTSEIYSPRREYSFARFLKHSVPERAGEIMRKRIPVDIFRSYLRDVLQRIPYPIHKTLVTELDKKDDGFHVQCKDGSSFVARHVIVATGIEPHKFLPPALAALRSDRVVHAWNVDQFQGTKGKNILVVGAGQSAGEAVCALSKENDISWLLRHDPVFYNEPVNLPTPVFNFILRISPLYFYLPGIIKKKLAKKFVESTITPDLQPKVTNEKVKRLYGNVEDMGLQTVDDGKIFSTRYNTSFDMVVAATGYRYSITSMRFIAPELRSRIAHQNGIPHLSFRFQTSVENLYMVGGIAEPMHGPTQRFVMGTYHAARGIEKIAHRFVTPA